MPRPVPPALSPPPGQEGRYESALQLLHQREGCCQGGLRQARETDMKNLENRKLGTFICVAMLNMYSHPLQCW